MIYLGDTTPEMVEAALMEIAKHAPLDTEIGKPRGANREGDTVLITTFDGTVWMVSPENVDRYVQLGDGAHIVTSWRWRILVDEQVGYDHR